MNPDPPRKCGRKKPDSFYIEGSLVPGGSLHAWTWLLGNGVDDILPVELPPRQMSLINPRACIASGEKVLADDEFVPIDTADGELYIQLENSIKNVGIGDHVGKNNYSAYSFAKETAELGASRRVNRDIAELYARLIAQFGAVPIIFSHSRVPVFADKRHFKGVFGFCKTLWHHIGERSWHGNACWRLPEWGMYARHDQYDGRNSAMTLILATVDALDNNWNAHRAFPLWQEAKEKFDNLMYQEQLFGGSWITQVTYTLPDDKMINPAIWHIPGINILNLEVV